ncbi:hypothetical protein ACFVXC_41340 [Streptomyces sp. NPDC058257]|uniref:hypothetical protein n=1 Tax=Streptomyces sp. NPDC058257 TaxID=3346409 RepID=UPI0036E24E63
MWDRLNPIERDGIASMPRAILSAPQPAARSPWPSRVGSRRDLTRGVQGCLRRGATRCLRRLWAPQRAALPIATRTRWRRCAEGWGRSG